MVPFKSSAEYYSLNACEQTTERVEIITQKQQGVNIPRDHKGKRIVCVPSTTVVNPVMKEDWIESSKNYSVCSGEKLVGY